MNVEVTIRVNHNRFGETERNIEISEGFNLVLRHADDQHSDRARIVSRIDELLALAGIKNNGSHG